MYLKSSTKDGENKGFHSLPVDWFLSSHQEYEMFPNPLVNF